MYTRTIAKAAVLTGMIMISLIDFLSRIISLKGTIESIAMVLWLAYLSVSVFLAVYELIRRNYNEEEVNQSKPYTEEEVRESVARIVSLAKLRQRDSLGRFVKHTASDEERDAIIY